MAYQAKSDEVPHGSAGLSAQARPSTVEEIGRGPYTDLVMESIDIAANVGPNSPQPTRSLAPGVSTARPDMHEDAR